MLSVWALLHEPSNNTRNLLTTGVHLAWSDYSQSSELDSAQPFPLVTQYVGEHVHIHTQRNQQTQVHSHEKKHAPFSQMWGMFTLLSIKPSFAAKSLSQSSQSEGTKRRVVQKWRTCILIGNQLWAQEKTLERRRVGTRERWRRKRGEKRDERKG